jgi:hypothetical protein
MEPTKTPPEDYYIHGILDLSKRKIQFGLNIIALAIFFIFYWIFQGLATIFRPEDSQVEGVFDLYTPIIQIILFIILMILIIIIHELIHGILFWYYTRELPEFAYKGAYAYAAAPKWFLPRNKFAVVGSSPLILITFIGMLFVILLPPQYLKIAIISLSINTAGSLGDAVTIIWLFNHHKHSLINDNGDIFYAYEPNHNAIK